MKTIKENFGLILLGIAIIAATIMIHQAQNRTHVPRLSVESFCASRSGEDIPAYNACVEGQQKAYDALKATWSDIPKETKIWCEDREYRGWADQSGYQAILACVQETEGEIRTFSY